MMVNKNEFGAVTDLASRGQLVTRVSASDADSGGDGDGGMRYSIVDGNTRQSFEIDALSGVISLSSLRTPDLLASNYVLNVSVTDGVFTNFARVKITVRHANSHVPRFERGVYSGEVFENLPRTSSILRVRATDPDSSLSPKKEKKKRSGLRTPSFLKKKKKDKKKEKA